MELYAKVFVCSISDSDEGASHMDGDGREEFEDACANDSEEEVDAAIDKSSGLMLGSSVTQPVGEGRPFALPSNEEQGQEEREEEKEEEKEEDGEEEEETLEASPALKVARPRSEKMPKYRTFCGMNASDRRSIYKLARNASAHQLKIINALKQQLAYERARVAILSSSMSTVYRLDVGMPSRFFPNEIGMCGPPARARVDADWVIRSRTSMIFDVSILQVTKDANCENREAYSTVDAIVSGGPVTLKVTLCKEDQTPVTQQYLSYSANDKLQNCCEFTLTTNTKRVSIQVRITSGTLKILHSETKFRLKFEAAFMGRALTEYTRPFLITHRSCAGKNKVENWRSDIMTRFCPECACCGAPVTHLTH